MKKIFFTLFVSVMVAFPVLAASPKQPLVFIDSVTPTTFGSYEINGHVGNTIYGGSTLTGISDLVVEVDADVLYYTKKPFGPKDDGTFSILWSNPSVGPHLITAGINHGSAPASALLNFTVNQ
jgi:hypothetical protein